MSERKEFVLDGAVQWENVADGVRRKVLAYGDDLMIVRVEFKKGAIGAVHHHPHRQGTYVARGSFAATVGGRTQTLNEGDTFFAAADVPHGVVALSDGALIDTFTPARKDFLRPAE
jgi:quercetin dioxygenase-like cupin family protein